MDLSASYLGLKLPHPLILGASPLVDDLDTVRSAEDAGAAAIVMHSLFEERILMEAGAALSLESHEDTFAEALYFRPNRDRFALGPDEYLEKIRRIKDVVSIPLIASLNGTTARGWLEYARLIDQAGADALELNVYRVAANADETAEGIEAETADMVRAIKSKTNLAVAIKLSPFYTSLSNVVERLIDAGADGLVLFNRFYQPDFDLEALEVRHSLELSSSSELLLRLRWLAILSAQLAPSVTLAASGGVHNAVDALKAVMAGAHGVQMVSEILHHGVNRFAEVRRDMEEWLEKHEYESLAQARGSLNSTRCPDPSAYERANYVRVLGSWRGNALPAR
ncbi:MAG TPA: dihydroorotate dehydrogenase-like protein [Polyangiaceae bacterium]|nr:dihydroorotate dehydrogenase-like protein [Polyangiaceae bacterium]